MLVDYEAAIRQIVTWMAEPNTVDALGCDREDYASELRLHVWEAQQVYRRRHLWSAQGEKQYVRRSLWNRSRSWLRSLYLIREVHERMQGGSEPVFDPEPYYEARNALRRLKQGLNGQTQTLFRVGLAETVREAFDPEIDGSWETFKRRVTRLRKKATKLVSPKLGFGR